MKCTTYVIVRGTNRVIKMEGDPYPGIPSTIEVDGEKFAVINRTEAQNYEHDIMAITINVDLYVAPSDF